MTARKPGFWILIATLSVLAAGVGAWKLMSSDSAVTGTTAPGAAPNLKAAPQFVLKTSQEKAHSLEDAKNQVVIVHFWASWCPPCLDELPEWVEFAKSFSQKHPQSPVMFYALSRDENWADALKIFPDANLPAKMVSVLDVGGKVSDLFGSYQYPETYVLNKKHEIVAKWVGAQPWDAKTEEALLRLAAE
ncbi:MAG: TlpA family protein disulfide reductase [Methylotenera sp.]|nr:TlpA family protein disulfide reductase [Oligoflexia bacterium]